MEGDEFCMYRYSEYNITIYKLLNIFRLSQVGVVSYGSECPSHGVYGRVTEVKHWIQFLAQEAEDTNCKQDIPLQQGNMMLNIEIPHWHNQTVDQLFYSQDS